MNSSYSIVPLPRIGDRRRPRLHLLFGVVRSVNRADGIIEEPCDRGSVRLFVVPDPVYLRRRHRRHHTFVFPSALVLLLVAHFIAGSVDLAF